MVMVAWDNTGEMGRIMIMQDSVGSINFELGSKSHGKSFKLKKETCSYLCFRKITLKKRKKNISTMWKIGNKYNWMMKGLQVRDDGYLD